MPESILLKAEEIINGQRAKDYGDARENHQRIAGLWSAYTGNGFTPEDVAVMMILLKIARFMENGYHHDTVVDIAGYAGVLEKMQLPEGERYNRNPVGVRLEEATIAPAPAEIHKEGFALFTAELKQRQWDSRTFVPKDVRVRGQGGEVWTWHEDENSWLWACDGHPVNYGLIGEAPYTEVLARHDQKEAT